MLSEYQGYLKRMASYLSQCGLTCGRQLVENIEKNTAQVGYAIEQVYWYYTLLAKADTGNRLLDLPFEIGRKPDSAMRSAIRAEYMIYRSGVEPLFDWGYVQELLEPKEEEEILPIYEPADQPEPELAQAQEDEPEPADLLGITDEDRVSVEDSFAFLDDEDEYEDLQQQLPQELTVQTDSHDYYRELFAGETFHSTWDSPQEPPRRDDRVYNSEYRQEAIFREKIFIWYEKLEGVVKLW